MNSLVQLEQNQVGHDVNKSDVDVVGDFEFSDLEVVAQLALLDSLLRLLSLGPAVGEGVG